MDGELWKGVYARLSEVARVWPRRSKVAYSDAWVLGVYLWAALHDRPVSWACDARHWTAAALRDRPLPAPSTMSRRLRGVSLLLFFAAVFAAARERLPGSLVKQADAKPLPVGSYTKDKDARRGWAGREKARGYKLFTIHEAGAVDAWRLGPMNQSEVETARRLLPEAVARFGGGYVLGDSLYDSNPLHAVAWSCGCQLVAPRKKPHAGLGHRRHHPGRLRAIHLLGTPFGRSLYAARGRIERAYGHAGNYGGGLQPLPNWVRRPRRVALWVQAKLLIDAVRQTRKAALAA